MVILPPFAPVVKIPLINISPVLFAPDKYAAEAVFNATILPDAAADALYVPIIVEYTFAPEELYCTPYDVPPVLLLTVTIKLASNS